MALQAPLGAIERFEAGADAGIVEAQKVETGSRVEESSTKQGCGLVRKKGRGEGSRLAHAATVRRLSTERKAVAEKKGRVCVKGGRCIQSVCFCERMGQVVAVAMVHTSRHLVVKEIFPRTMLVFQPENHVSPPDHASSHEFPFLLVGRHRLPTGNCSLQNRESVFRYA